MEYVVKYKLSQPDKQYRKNAETFLNNKGWLDEIITPITPVTHTPNGKTVINVSKEVE